jgi:hypothetical protein
MAGTKQHWSVQKEYDRGKELGRFPEVDRADLRLAGMSLASISNMPQTRIMDVSHAPGALLDYVTGVSDLATSGTPKCGSTVCQSHAISLMQSQRLPLSRAAATPIFPPIFFYLTHQPGK